MADLIIAEVFGGIEDVEGTWAAIIGSGPSCILNGVGLIKVVGEVG